MAELVNPFSPQDAERLREARTDGSSFRVGRTLRRTIYVLNGETRHADGCIGIVEDCDDAAYLVNCANAVPAMLDLIDALREVAVAAVTWQDVGGIVVSGQAYDLHAKLRALRAGPHAEWLKQGR